MKPSRTLRLLVALFALLSLLSMQFAVASYVCPGMGNVDGSASNVMMMTPGQKSMSGCEGMDTNQAALCHIHAHDQGNKQSLDKPEPTVPPFLPAALIVTLDSIAVASRPGVAYQVSPLLSRATAPPIAIRNCCFRI